MGGIARRVKKKDKDTADAEIAAAHAAKAEAAAKPAPSPSDTSTASPTTKSGDHSRSDKHSSRKTAEPKTPHRTAAKRKRRPLTREDVLEDLPQIRTLASIDEKRAVFVRKLRLCSYICDFHSDGDDIDKEVREMKRNMLVELIDFLSTSRNWVSDDSLKAILYMISCNLFRSLPPSLYDGGYDPDEDEPTHDPAWVHLQFVYEFLLRFIVSSHTDPKMLKKYIDRKFLLSIIDLFESEDPRERDYLKTILHRIYGKFMSFRSFLRRSINNVFFHVIYRNPRHNGLAELLEILGSIINGFATPLKDEHRDFLQKVLVPLHKSEWLKHFHAQLAYCVVQFIEKEPPLAGMVVSGLLKYWPVSNADKELLFLSELEEVLELTDPSITYKFLNVLFGRISTCIGSDHFQVAERALFLWNNDVIASFMSDYRDRVLPLLYPALYANLQHWNSTVTQLTAHIMQQFRDMDEKLYLDVESRFDAEAEKKKRKRRAKKYKALLKSVRSSSSS